MLYTVHVIDYASQLESNESGKHAIVPGQSSSNEKCDIVESDAWYRLYADSAINAVIEVSRIARVKDSDDTMLPLADAFAKTKKKYETGEIRPDESEEMLIDIDIDIAYEGMSQRFAVNCEIPRVGSGDQVDESWIEFHRVVFYATPEEKVMLIES